MPVCTGQQLRGQDSRWLYLLVALVAMKHGIAHVQDVLGDLELLGQRIPLALSLCLGFPELCDLHAVSLHQHLSGVLSPIARPAGVKCGKVTA